MPLEVNLKDMQLDCSCLIYYLFSFNFEFEYMSNVLYVLCVATS